MTFIPAPKKTYVQAIIWARVSSEEQRSGHSIDTQIANGKKYCDERNLYVIDTIDAVESSNKEVRHKFLAMIEFVEKQKEPINLVIQSVDRLHRDSKSFSTILALKDKGKLIIHCTRDGAVYDKYNNDIVYQMQHMMANLETKTLGSRVITGFARKAEEGTILGQVAVGYLSEKHRNKEIHKNPIVSIDWDKAVHIQRIFELYATGNYSSEQIARTIGDEGFITREGNKPVKNSIEYILKNKFYIGYYETIYGIATHPYETFISEDLFNRCGEVRHQRRKVKAKGITVAETQSKEVHLYNSFIKCKHCNSSYSTDEKKGQTYLKTSKLKDRCHHCKNIRADIVTPQIVEILKRISISQDTLDILHDELKDKIKARSDVRQKQIEQLEGKLTEISEQKKENLRRLMSKDPETSITLNIYTNMEHMLDDDTQQINVKLATLKKTDKEFRNSSLSIFELASRAAELWVSADNIRKREIMKIIFSNLYLDGKTLIFTMRKPFNLFLKEANHTVWLPIARTLRTKRREDVMSFATYSSEMRLVA